MRFRRNDIFMVDQNSNCVIVSQYIIGSDFRSFVATLWWGYPAHRSTSYTYKQLFTKVNTDLRATHYIFDQIQIDRQTALTALANSSAFLAH